jgi:hypothetical protein
MAVIPKPVAIGYLGATATTMYTCPANTIAKVMRLDLTNTDTDAIGVDIYKVATGGTASAANTIAVAGTSTYPAGLILAAYEPRPIPQCSGILLTAGDTLQGKAGEASKITYSVSVIEFT